MKSYLLIYYSNFPIFIIKIVLGDICIFFVDRVILFLFIYCSRAIFYFDIFVFRPNRVEIAGRRAWTVVHWGVKFCKIPDISLWRTLARFVSAWLPLKPRWVSIRILRWRHVFVSLRLYGRICCLLVVLWASYRYWLGFCWAFEPTFGPWPMKENLWF